MVLVRLLAGKEIERPAVIGDLAVDPAELSRKLGAVCHRWDATYWRPDGRALLGAGTWLSPFVTGEGVHHQTRSLQEHETLHAGHMLRPEHDRVLGRMLRRTERHRSTPARYRQQRR